MCLAVPDPASYASVRICVGDMVSPPTRYCFGRQEMNRNFDQMKLSSRQSQILSERSSTTRQQQQTACGMRRCLAHGRLAVAEACGLHRMHACKEEVAYTCDMRASGLRLLSAHSPCVGFGRTASSITEWATTTKKHPRDVVRVPLARCARTTVGCACRLIIASARLSLQVPLFFHRMAGAEAMTAFQTGVTDFIDKIKKRAVDKRKEMQVLAAPPLPCSGPHRFARANMQSGIRCVCPRPRRATATSSPGLARAGAWGLGPGAGAGAGAGLHWM